MSALPTNVLPFRRFENGGKIEMSDGVDTHEIFNVEAGSVRVRDGGRAVSQQLDRGVLLPPTLGDQQPSSIEGRLKFTGATAANNFRSLMSNSGVTDANKQEYTVIITWFDDVGQTTGEKVTYAESYFTNHFSVEVAGPGADPDMVPFAMASRTVEGVWETVL